MSDNIADTFKKIHQEHSDGIFRFCLVRVSSREDALDNPRNILASLEYLFREQGSGKQSRISVYHRPSFSD